MFQKRIKSKDKGKNKKERISDIQIDNLDESKEKTNDSDD
jgi:hypothetical protein